MFLFKVLFSIILFGCGLSKCNISEADNSTRICLMGDCFGNQCVCDPGWAGVSCDHCKGRIMLNDSSGFLFDGLQNYSHQSKCSWLIQPSVKLKTCNLSSKGRHAIFGTVKYIVLCRHSSLRLRFHEFATECGWDHLYVYDGDSAFSPLIGSFNGLLYTPSQTNRQMPEIVAKSGTAFLHFYSDAAFSMSGFNISYSVDSCQYDCFGKGNCTEGECKCHDERQGQSCNLCHNNCSTESNDLFECLSSDISTCEASDAWRVFQFDKDLPARASSAASLHNGSVWIYGGLQFSKQIYSSGFVTKFDPSQNKGNTYEPSSKQNLLPNSRYEHSMVTWNDKLIIFGGKLVKTEKAVNEMWEFDIALLEWTPVAYLTSFGDVSANASSGMSQLMLSGHSADLIKFSNGSEIMVVLFGFHPFMTFTKFVYEYNPSTKLWIMPRPSGYAVPGLFGHTTAYDPVSNLIYIHGGYRLGANEIKLSSNTYSYDPINRHFTMLRSSGRPRYLHSASFINGVMYVYGGNTHNGTNENADALCFSSNFMAYLSACDSWITLPSPPSSLNPNRYGHHSIVVNSMETNNRMYVFSGYNGAMISNALIYYPMSCTNFQNQSTCPGNLDLGISCYWNNTNCLPLLPTTSNVSLLETSCNTTNMDDFCADPELESSCTNCLSTSSNCTYVISKCVFSNYNKKSCEDETDSYCQSLINCEQCKRAWPECAWNGTAGCVKGGSGGTDGDPPSCVQFSKCSSASSCDDCGRLSFCMWCVNPEKCLPTNTYVLQFPYGQCMEWTNGGNTCPVQECSSHKTCAECQSYPQCGWCDDGSLTGQGTCLDGSGSGPVVFNSTSGESKVDNQTCPFPFWYFSSCPACQCNGHSTCDADDQCKNCSDNTTGNQCENCIDGFYGDPLNGGNCSVCQCNGKALTCESESCNCFTKGVTGVSCELCDIDNSYMGNATGNGTCFYPLLENFIFTFTLGLTDQYITAINFQNTPKQAENVQLSLSSEVPCNVRLAFLTDTPEYLLYGETTLTSFFNVTSASYSFSNNNFNFGQLNATIKIYVSNFTSPNTIKVSVLQRSNLLLIVLLIIFCSFLAILITAAVVWKLKLMYDTHRLRINRSIQMKEMAARPFAGITLNCDDTERSSQALLAPGSCGNQSASKESLPFAFCEEKCAEDSSSVISVFLWLPSNVPNKANSQDGDCSSIASNATHSFVTPPPGQTSLAIGTVLTSRRDVITYSPIKKSQRTEVSESCHPDELSSSVNAVKPIEWAYDNHAMQAVQI